MTSDEKAIINSYVNTDKTGYLEDSISQSAKNSVIDEILSDLNSHNARVIAEVNEKCKLIKKDYEKDRDGEKHRNELEVIILEILNNNGFTVLAEVFKTMPSY